MTQAESYEILEYISDYKVPVVYVGLEIPDAVEMTKWRDGSDIITTYRDGSRYWHFRQSFTDNSPVLTQAKRSSE